MLSLNRLAFVSMTCALAAAATAQSADVSTQAVRAAAASATEVPPEFQKLGYRLREVASRRP